MIRVSVFGVPQARAALARAGAGLLAGASPATQAAARTILEAAQQRIEASPAVRTRALLESLTVEASQGSPAGASAEVVTDVDYAPFVEFGTSKMPPEPFMQPAADEGSVKAFAAAAAIFRAALGRAV